MHPQFHSLTVCDIERQTPDSVAISFELPGDDAEDFAFRPGQYVTLRTVIDGQEIRRPYSICCTPGIGRLRVGVKQVEGGVFSTFVNEKLSAGDIIEVMPPEGRFGIDIGGSHDYLLVAAGSGITPILAIARSVLEREPKSTVTLVFGNRATGSIMFLEELEDLKDRFLGRFTLIHVLSRETQDVDILNGRVDKDRLGDLTRHGLIDPKGADSIFVCGPGDMIEGVQQALVGLGVDEARIHFERFTPADGQEPRKAPSAATQAAAAAGIEVETILDGLRQTFEIANPEDTVLTAAQAAGIDLPYSCAGGMCCTCRCKVVEGKGEMAVNYSLEPWEIEAGYTLACQTRPTTKKLVLDFDAV